MPRAVLDGKIQSFADAKPRPDLIATGNPGCLMQIGAGLLAARLPIGVAHPVELLDWSYADAGLYEGEGRKAKGEGRKGKGEGGRGKGARDRA